MPNYRTAIAATCAALALTTTAACTDNPPGSTVTPPPTTLTTSPTPTPSKPQPPALPAAAKTKSKAGLEAFARHWLKVEAYMQATGDSRAYKSLFVAECELCGDLVQIYSGVYAAGGRYEGDTALQVERINLLTLMSSAGVIEFRGHFAELTKTSHAGATPETQAAADADYTVNARFLNGTWKVTETVITEVEGG